MHIALNAQLLSTAAGYRSAGVSTYSLHLLQELGALAAAGTGDHHFTAWTNDPDFTAPGIEIMRTNLPADQPSARIVWEQSLFVRALRQAQADVVHGLVNVLPLAATIPGIVTVHDLSFVRLPETLPRAKRIYLRRLCAASVARAARVIAVSSQTAVDLMEYFATPSARIEVIPNGVDGAFAPGDDATVAAFRRKKQLPARFILYVGTLEPRKNLPLLLRAYAAWRAQRDDPAPLVLVGGKGWFYAEIFALVEELGLRQSVRFTGFVPSEELPRWYQAATLFVYPSRLEGFGLPVLEAMACGTPVICSDAPSLLEVAGDVALIVSRAEVDGVPQLTDALTRLMEDAALRTELGRRGLVQAARFSWQRTAQATVDVYNWLD